MKVRKPLAVRAGERSISRRLDCDCCSQLAFWEYWSSGSSRATVHSHESARRHCICSNHLMQMACCLENYIDYIVCRHRLHVADADGKPMAQLCEPDFCRTWAESDFTPDTTSANLGMVRESVPYCTSKPRIRLRCPSRVRACSNSRTTYVAVTGRKPQGLREGNHHGRSDRRITGNPHNPGVIEVAVTMRNPWMEPRDLQYGRNADGGEP